MKNLNTAFFANSCMAKTVVKVFPRGKVFWVRACKGSEVAMKMTGKWCSEDMQNKDLSGLASLESISGIRLWSPFICFTEKSYFENQSFSLSNIFSGTFFPLKFMMLGKAELSILTRK